MISPSSVAPIAQSRPITALRSIDVVRSTFENAAWNHFVVNPEYGSVWIVELSNEKIDEDDERHVEEDDERREVRLQRPRPAAARRDVHSALAVRRSAERKRPKTSIRTSTTTISQIASTAP